MKTSNKTLNETTISLIRKKLIKNCLSFFVVVLFHPVIFSQPIVKPTISQTPHIIDAAKKTEIISANRLNIPTALNATDTTLFPSISLVNPAPKIEQYYSRDFQMYKDTAKLIYTDQPNGFQAKLPSPFRINFGFDANKSDKMAPLDNTIACSGNNNLVSISNAFIEYYSNATLKYRTTLNELINFSVPSPCDPKVYFDPTADRFIVFVQRCDRNYNNSEIIVGFSISNNPVDGWNFYKLSGNPLNKPARWFDYPKIAISHDGLFISGNIFIGDNGFDQTVVYQIDKNLGFAGQKLKYRVWFDIADNPFTIQPVGYAFDNTYTKGIFLLSTTWQNNANYIKLYDVTGSIYDANSTMNFYKVPTTPYKFFAEAVQLNQNIDNGDIRIQDAVLADDKIFYAFTSGNEHNFSRININCLEIPSLKNKSILIGDNSNFSYAYPSLHLFSQEGEKLSVVIQYNGTSNQSLPDIRCKACDDQLNCSQEMVVRRGETTINNDSRWGDYSGIAKNQSKQHDLWLTSTYGNNKIRQTWISNIVPISQPEVPTDSIFANNLLSSKTVVFLAPDQMDVQVLLISKNEVKELYAGKIQKGNNTFEIVTNQLDLGDYKIEIRKKKSLGIIKDVPFTTVESKFEIK